MKTTTRNLWPCILLVAMTMGCAATPPTRLYLLEPSQSIPSSGDKLGVTIAIGPLTLPDRLNRKEILFHARRHQPEVVEFDQWAEPLDYGMTAVLAENISLMVPTDQVIVYPWDGAHDPDLTVRLRILSFGPAPHNKVKLSGFWTIDHEIDNLTQRNKFTYQRDFSGATALEAVESMSALLEELSADLATALRKQSLGENQTTRGSME